MKRLAPIAGGLLALSSAALGQGVCANPESGWIGNECTVTDGCVLSVPTGEHEFKCIDPATLGIGVWTESTYIYPTTADQEVAIGDGVSSISPAYELTVRDSSALGLAMALDKYVAAGNGAADDQTLFTFLGEDASGNEGVTKGSLAALWTGSPTAGAVDGRIEIQTVDNSVSITRFTVAHDGTLVLEGTGSDDANELTLTTSPTADRTITFPDESGTICTDAGGGCGGGSCPCPITTKTVTTNYTTLSTDEIIFADTDTTSPLTITLLTVASAPTTYTIKNVGGGRLIIDPAGSEQIEGSSTVATNRRTSLRIGHDGTEWWIL